MLPLSVIDSVWLSQRNRRLVKKYGCQIVTLSQVPHGHAAFKASCGDEPCTLLPAAVGYVRLPMDALICAVMADPELREAFTGWGDYHAWYMTNNKDIPQHRRVWPVILSDSEDETLFDGWHRLHRYYAQSVTVVPAIWFHYL